MPYPPQVTTWINNIRLPLRVQLLRDIDICFGADSMVAREERNFFAARVAGGHHHLLMGMRSQSYVPLDGSAIARNRFVEDMNRLLGWAAYHA
jgi:hypothetical protein